MLTPEESTFITQCRVKAQEGTITLEEQKRAILILRAGRTKVLETNAAARAAKPKAAKAAPRDTDELLAGLEGF